MGTIESLLGLENIKPEDMVSIKQQLQDLNDAIRGGLRSANLKEYRNTYVINAQDSLDASYPMYVHFNIIPEMVKIVSINVSFWFQNFRAYATAASSGGGSTPTSGASSESSSANGGGETPTSSSGGGSTPTSSSGGEVSSASGGGETPTSSDGGAQTSGAGGDETTGGGGAGTGWYTDYTNIPSTPYDHRHLFGLPDHTHGQVHHHHSVADHTHTITVAAHTHTGGAHTHTVTVAAHTHTVTVAAHTHGIAHTHTVTIAAHAHSITYGIFEDSTSPTIMFYVSRDNGLTYSLPIGSYTADHENLDITNFIDAAGSKMIKFTSNARTRLSVQITITLDIKAR